jgi:hypothetical protein
VVISHLLNITVKCDAQRLAVACADVRISTVDAYSRLLHHPDPHVRDKAARDWCDWEESHINLGPTQKPVDRHSRSVISTVKSWRHNKCISAGSAARFG